MIPGQHHDAEAFVGEIRKSLRRGLFYGVANREEAHGRAADGNEDHGCSLPSEHLGPAGEIARRQAFFAHHTFIA